MNRRKPVAMKVDPLTVSFPYCAPKPGPLDVECPHCGSPVAERCCTEWYYLRPRFPTRKPHAARIRAAQKEADRAR